jgi:hypothetical protein
MKSIQFIAFAAFAALFQTAGAADASVTCPADNYSPSKYRIYVDPASGDAYVQTPCGWRFVRTIEAPRIPEAIRMSKLQPADLERRAGNVERQDY